jgi:hypothetical protein
MKRIRKYMTGIALLLCFNAMVLTAAAQPLPPEDHTSPTDSSPGGGAPVGNGTLLLIMLAVGYAGTKAYSLSKQEEE